MITCLLSRLTPKLAGGHGRYVYRFPTCTQVIGSRSFSNSNARQSRDLSSHIPEPTWSVKSLELTSQHAKLPPDEVERLAHLALLDLYQLPKDLEQDLANMMHMVQQVSDFVEDPSNKALFIQDDDTGSFQYDFVRGVTAAPFRSAHDPPDAEDLEEASQVWETYLNPNTIRQGGAHQYFAISTKQQEESDK
jgi:hypothetical protein